MSTRPFALASLLALAGCGDNLQPEDSQQSAYGNDDGSGADAPARAIDASIFIETITCKETIARYEAEAHYTDDNAQVTDIACLWTFDDGTTSTSCAGEHPFADAGSHDFVLEVTDLSTGATAVTTQNRFFHPPLELTLEVSSHDLTISYMASSNTGGDPVVFVTPEELVFTEDDPNYPVATTATLRVRQPGTYTVTYDVEDERGVSEICVGRVVKQVDVTCTGDGHVH